MSMMLCSECGEMKDTDFDNGEFVGDSDYVCEYCIGSLTDEELEVWGITR
jgi:hypothetical protein